MASGLLDVKIDGVTKSCRWPRMACDCPALAKTLSSKTQMALAGEQDSITRLEKAVIYEG